MNTELVMVIEDIEAMYGLFPEETVRRVEEAKRVRAEFEAGRLTDRQLQERYVAARMGAF
jgi:hypothetical protein